MKKLIQAIIVLSCAALSLQAMAEQARQLTWNDLVPADLVKEDPFAKLTPEQQNLLILAIHSAQQVSRNSQQIDEGLVKEMVEAVPSLKKAGIDVDKILAKIKEIETSVVQELDGKRVRIAGYLLPLEVAGANVTEFLLVPYVGACIHVPPPPPNQIVYVKVTKNAGYDGKGRFEPVWVTGVLSAKSMVKDLFLVDGSAGIDIGYSMQADRIEPYKE